MKMEQTQCSETLAFKLQTPVTHPEESIRHSEHGDSLKSRMCYVFRPFGKPSGRFDNNIHGKEGRLAGLTFTANTLKYIKDRILLAIRE
jgi:hypothetical protein